MAPGPPSHGPPPGQPPPGAIPPGQPPPGAGPPPGYPGYPQQPPPGYGYGVAVKPHRGTVILVLGICGFAVCVICGIIAWVMANSDLREMEAGTMDREGYQLTNAGRLCGMISTIFALIGLGIFVVFMVIFAAGAAASGP